jgi:hypothetical protein
VNAPAAPPPLWDGRAAERVADVLLDIGVEAAFSGAQS